MSCTYRIILCFDGGPRSLEAPVLTLNYLQDRFFDAAGERFTFSWVDLSVGYGESNILPLLLAACPDRFHVFIKSLAAQMAMKGPLQMSWSDHPCMKYNFRDLQKHVLLTHHDLLTGKLIPLTTTSPYQDSMRVDALLDRFVRRELTDITNTGQRTADDLVFNPIQHAVNLATCLYPDDSLVFISFGTQARKLATKITSELDHLHLQEQARQNKKLHYFRIAPPIDPACTFMENKKNVETFLEQEIPSVDRLYRLMEIKAGRLL